MDTSAGTRRSNPWNQGKLVGQKARFVPPRFPWRLLGLSYAAIAMG
jgi:hypothetical protein